MNRITYPLTLLCTLTWLNTASAQPAGNQQPAVAFPEAPEAAANPPPPPPPPPYATGAPPSAAAVPATSSAPQTAYPPPPGAPGPTVEPSVAPPSPAPVPATTAAAPTYATEPPPSSYVAPPAKQEIKIPDFSVRLDPLNWLLEGKLGFEIEVEAFEWLTIETVPVFVVASEPIVLPDFVYQKSDGWGPLAGASLSAGFWLEGDSFRGTVLRAGITSYAFRYHTVGQSGEMQGEVFDEVALSEQRLTFMIGSGRRWGYFTIAGGMGIEYDLSDERRCVQQVGTQYEATSDNCPRGDFVVLRRKSELNAANLRGPLFPVEFLFRLSLGFVLDRP